MKISRKDSHLQGDKPEAEVDIAILVGEHSGDLQGSDLIQQLLTINPHLKLASGKGPRMRQFPIQIIEPMESLQVIGFIDVLKELPKLIRLFYSIRKKLLELSPQILLTVDYPEFNFWLQKSLRKNGYLGKQIHYISPTVWAWRKNRVFSIANSVDQLLTILPFEPQCFKKTKLSVQYVGHPLTEKIAKFKPDPTFRERFGFKETDKILSLFPGSRKQEIERNLSPMLESAKKLQTLDPDLKIAICGEDFIPFSENYNLMHESFAAFAKSGTVTLELALFQIPTLVQYAIKPLDVFIATKLFRIDLPFYSLPNLIAQKEIFKELFGPHLTPESHFSHAKELWFDSKKQQTIREECKKLWEILGSHSASQAAAKQILSAIQT